MTQLMTESDFFFGLKRELFLFVYSGGGGGGTSGGSSSGRGGGNSPVTVGNCAYMP